MTIFIIYLIGFVLAFGRAFGMYCSIDKEHIKTHPPEGTLDDFFYSLFGAFGSWFVFLFLCYYYTSHKEDTIFLAYSKRKLWKEYYKHNPKK
jgi:hypothetical protein